MLGLLLTIYFGTFVWTIEQNNVYNTFAITAFKQNGHFFLNQPRHKKNSPFMGIKIKKPKIYTSKNKLQFRMNKSAINCMQESGLKICGRTDKLSYSQMSCGPSPLKQKLTYGSVGRHVIPARSMAGC